MPLSYHGFGPAAILLMVATLIIAELYKLYKNRKQHS